SLKKKAITYLTLPTLLLILLKLKLKTDFNFAQANQLGKGTRSMYCSRKFRRNLFPLMLLISTWPLIGSAQVPTRKVVLKGKVFDQNRAAISGANIRVERE